MSLKNKIIAALGVLLIVLVNVLTVMHVLEARNTDTEIDTFAFGDPESITFEFNEEDGTVNSMFDRESVEFARLLYLLDVLFESSDSFAVLGETEDELDTAFNSMLKIDLSADSAVSLPIENGCFEHKASAVSVIVTGEDKGKLIVYTEGKSYVLGTVELTYELEHYLNSLYLSK